ncbi:MAG: polysaccharide biosynthesis C-terminal domain-containing protein [Pseudomonas sp.]
MKSAIATDASESLMKAELFRYACLILTKGSGAGATLGTFMTMTGHHRQYLNYNITACEINVALNLLLIPRYGVTGACFATAVALFLKNFLLYIQFKNIKGVQSHD